MDNKLCITNYHTVPPFHFSRICSHPFFKGMTTDVEEALRLIFPDATAAECKRFVVACSHGGKRSDRAVKKETEIWLKDHLDWRRCHGLDDSKTETTQEEQPTSDAEDWQCAVEKALGVEEYMKRGAKELEEELEEKLAELKLSKYKPVKGNDKNEIDDAKTSENKNGRKETKSDHINDESKKENGSSGKKDNEGFAEQSKLFQFVFLHKSQDGKPIKDKNGYSILHVLPAMINKEAASAETFGLAIALYLDRKLDRSSDEKMTVFLDVRAGEGWPNPVAFAMVNFVRKVMKILQAHYPERCESLILFPVPRAAMAVWGAMKRIFRHGIMGKIVLVQGPALQNSPLPKVELEEFIDGEVLDLSEHARINSFNII